MGEVTDEEVDEARRNGPKPESKPDRCGECGCELPNHFVYCSQSKPDPRMNDSACSECGLGGGGHHPFCPNAEPVTTSTFPTALAQAMGFDVDVDKLVLGNPIYMQLLRYMEELHVAKAAGYSGEGTDTWKNFREAELWGVTAWLGCAIRLGDKYRRLQNILRNPQLDMLTGESALVTAIDLAAYALILVCLLNEAGVGDVDEVTKVLK